MFRLIKGRHIFNWAKLEIRPSYKQASRCVLQTGLFKKYTWLFLIRPPSRKVQCQYCHVSTNGMSTCHVAIKHVMLQIDHMSKCYWSSCPITICPRIEMLLDNVSLFHLSTWHASIGKAVVIRLTRVGFVMRHVTHATAMLTSS